MAAGSALGCDLSFLGVGSFLQLVSCRLYWTQSLWRWFERLPSLVPPLPSSFSLLATCTASAPLHTCVVWVLFYLYTPRRWQVEYRGNAWWDVLQRCCLWEFVLLHLIIRPLGAVGTSLTFFGFSLVQIVIPRVAREREVHYVRALHSPCRSCFRIYRGFSKKLSIAHY